MAGGMKAAAMGVLGACAALLVLTLPASARAADGGIPTYDVVLTLRPDGVLHVRETVTVDFVAAGRRGIVRRVPYRAGDRLYEIRRVRASSSTGAPALPQAVKFMHEVQLRVGEGRSRSGGLQSYVIEYEVAGAVTPGRTLDTLVWDAIGPGRSGAIGEAVVRVRSPIPLGRAPGAGRAECTAGTRPAGTRCGSERAGPYGLVFSQSGLRPGEGMTIRLTLPRGALRASPPRYAEPHLEWTGLGWALLAAAAGASIAVRRVPVRRGAGLALGAAGLVVLAVDAADDVLAGGLWAASIGDPALAGLGCVIIGFVIFRSDRKEPAAAIRQSE
ncbi:hypothetical protein DPM19_08230 [Actinomadura craniellae]|uniref:DUF2207 domain-containing protein n=1 Tax=Actinomadura craniellae TaxID=2231787 RepID=A0A365H9D7_9ACTN|nr:DUF2207 domain-containing protein [Actinomadura craniellae]RAY15754.1 hypothetical protein DPM19_08230 [Actinomadura craniellae]